MHRPHKLFELHPFRVEQKHFKVTFEADMGVCGHARPTYVALFIPHSPTLLALCGHVYALRTVK